MPISFLVFDGSDGGDSWAARPKAHQRYNPHAEQAGSRFGLRAHQRVDTSKERCVTGTADHKSDEKC